MKVESIICDLPLSEKDILGKCIHSYETSDICGRESRDCQEKYDLTDRWSTCVIEGHFSHEEQVRYCIPGRKGQLS